MITNLPYYHSAILSSRGQKDITVISIHHNCNQICHIVGLSLIEEFSALIRARITFLSSNQSENYIQRRENSNSRLFLGCFSFENCLRIIHSQTTSSRITLFSQTSRITQFSSTSRITFLFDFENYSILINLENHFSH